LGPVGEKFFAKQRISHLPQTKIRPKKTMLKTPLKYGSPVEVPIEEL